MNDKIYLLKEWIDDGTPRTLFASKNKNIVEKARVKNVLKAQQERDTFSKCSQCKDDFFRQSCEKRKIVFDDFLDEYVCLNRINYHSEYHYEIEECILIDDEKYSNTMFISALPIGAKVKFGRYSVENESVEHIIWLVAAKNHAGYPDNSVTLLAEKIVDLRAFDAREKRNSDANVKKYGNNRYLHSNLLQWLNSRAAKGRWYSPQHSADAIPIYSSTSKHFTDYDYKAGFMSLFTDEEYGAILTTSVVTAKNTVTAGGGSENVSSKLFLLSRTEVGLDNEINIAEGSLLPLFSDDASRVCKVTEQCIKNTFSANKPSTTEDSWYWWLRTPYASDSCGECAIYSSGVLDTYYAFNNDFGVRPALNLSNNLRVSSSPGDDGCYEILL